ncbi:hypothetical protein [Peptoniphilus sp.]|uniref:hypothetical protein n=1 Tax=Peptoniphilus sp. TaxID=1971214 RepID=UPI002A82C051|nr:hypothetical protein [Peptoniphilus sp.]MDY3902925.1 hypothetical protein [Peptoniphilus sp.]
MTVYRWGKFERKENYKTVTSGSLRSYGGGDYGIVGRVYKSWSYEKGLYDEISRSDMDESRVYYGSGSDAKDYCDVIIYRYYNNAAMGSGWEYNRYGIERTERTVFSHYSKGSRLDTVTSTNRNAYPNDGESGDYWYVYEGIANQTPTISGKDEDLGGFKAPFKRVFSVDDPDNNETLNVTVKLNSATIRTINNATKGESYEIDIDKAKFDELELNKTNTIEITVSDSNGASAIRRYTFKKVNSNPVVTVTNSNMGEQNKPFSFNFNANDPDGDDITVKVYVDDVQLQDLGKVTPNQSKTVSIEKLDYAKLQNGEHRIKIEATDSFGAKGVGYITFSKNINYCWYRLTKEVDAQPSAVVVNPLTELAKGAKMTVKVALNAKDSSPTWEVVPEELIGQKYNFKTKTKTADKWCIGVDIRIDRADTPEGKTSYFYGFVGAYM